MYVAKKANNARIIVKQVADRLGEQKYMAAANISNDDYRAFESLYGYENAVLSSGTPNLIRWFKEIESLNKSTIQVNCSFCGKNPQAISTLMKKIAASETSDCIISCSDCTQIQTDLNYYTNKLANQRFIEDSEICTQKEKDTYDKVNKYSAHIRKYQLTYQKLNVYLVMMEELLKFNNDVICLGCGHPFKYTKYENLLFGYQEDSPFCVQCYYTCLEKLVRFGRELKDQKSFNGNLEVIENYVKDNAKYMDVRSEAKHAKHTLYPHLVQWCEMMESRLTK